LLARVRGFFLSLPNDPDWFLSPFPIQSLLGTKGIRKRGERVSGATTPGGKV